jgi:hypothetical protein
MQKNEAITAELEILKEEHALLKDAKEIDEYHKNKLLRELKEADLQNEELKFENGTQGEQLSEL